MGVIQAKYSMKCSVVEEITTGVAGAASAKRQITYDNFDVGGTLLPDGSVPVSKVVATTKALTTGALTLDFTSITGANNLAQDMTGLRLQLLMIANPTGNGSMNFAEGASDGYEALGNGFDFTLLAGQRILFYGNEATPEVASGAKTIDVAGTGSQSFQLVAVFG